jgi:hypothetical protein
MSAYEILEKEPAADPRSRPPMQVMLVYEDLSTGLRARQAFERCVNQLAIEVDFDWSLWSFSLLEQSEIFEQTLNEAVKADIVFLSAHGKGNLPPAVKSWLDRWLGQKSGEPAALAISFDPEMPSDLAEAQLAELVHAAARTSGVEVFLHLGEAPKKEPGVRIEAIQRHGSGDHPYRDWGLNE